MLIFRLCCACGLLFSLVVRRLYSLTREMCLFLIAVGRPTAENFVPIRLDLDIDGQRFKDAFTWNPNGIFASFLITICPEYSSIICLMCA